MWLSRLRQLSWISCFDIFVFIKTGILGCFFRTTMKLSMPPPYTHALLFSRSLSLIVSLRFSFGSGDWRKAQDPWHVKTDLICVWFCLWSTKGWFIYYSHCLNHRKFPQTIARLELKVFRVCISIVSSGCSWCDGGRKWSLVFLQCVPRNGHGAGKKIFTGPFARSPLCWCTNLPENDRSRTRRCWGGWVRFKAGWCVEWLQYLKGSIMQHMAHPPCCKDGRGPNLYKVNAW